jgi:hypothetical protein
MPKLPSSSTPQGHANPLEHRAAQVQTTVLRRVHRSGLSCCPTACSLGPCVATRSTTGDAYLLDLVSSGRRPARSTLVASTVGYHRLTGVSRTTAPCARGSHACVFSGCARRRAGLVGVQLGPTLRSPSNNSRCPSAVEARSCPSQKIRQPVRPSSIFTDAFPWQIRHN